MGRGKKQKNHSENYHCGAIVLGIVVFRYFDLG